MICGVRRGGRGSRRCEGHAERAMAVAVRGGRKSAAMCARKMSDTKTMGALNSILLSGGFRPVVGGDLAVEKAVEMGEDVPDL